MGEAFQGEETACALESFGSKTLNGHTTKGQWRERLTYNKRKLTR